LNYKSFKKVTSCTFIVSIIVFASFSEGFLAIGLPLMTNVSSNLLFNAFKNLDLKLSSITNSSNIKSSYTNTSNYAQPNVALNLNPPPSVLNTFINNFIYSNTDSVGWLSYNLGPDFNNSNAYPSLTTYTGSITVPFNITREVNTSYSPITADLYQDGYLDIIVETSPSTISIYNANGIVINILNPPNDIGFSGGTITYYEVDYMNSQPMIVVGVLDANGNNPTVIIYNGNGSVAKIINTGLQGWIQPHLVDLQGNRNYDVVINFGDSYTGPRGVAVYSYSTGQRLWIYYTGPYISDISFSDLLGNGQKDIVLSTFAPCNGQTGNGTNDCTAYVIVLSPFGSVMWMHDMGQGQIHTRVAIIKLPGRSLPDVFFLVHSSDAVDPDGPNSITIFNGINGAVIYNYSGPNGDPWNSYTIVNNPNGTLSRIYVVGYNSGTIYEFNSTLNLIKTIVLQAPSTEQEQTLVAANLVKNGGTELIYRTELPNGTNEVYVLNATTLSILWIKFLPNMSNGPVIVSAIGNNSVNSILLTGNEMTILSPPSSFSQNIYTITFTENGLPSGTSWSVTLNGTTESSTSNSIVFNEPNGKYYFSIVSINGYSAYPSSGTLYVDNSGVSESVSFKQITLKDIAFSDNFSSDFQLNTALWSINSPYAQNLFDKLQQENILAFYPNFQNAFDYLQYSFYNDGMYWQGGGHGNAAVLTSDDAFVPPFNVTFQVYPYLGENDPVPVIILLSNPSLNSVFGFVYQWSTFNMYIIQGSQLIPIGTNDQPQPMRIVIQANFSEFSVKVYSGYSGNNILANYEGSVPPTSNDEYYLTIGSYYGNLVGSYTYSSGVYSTAAYFKSVTVTSPLRNLDVKLVNQNNQPLQGAAVLLQSIALNKNITEYTDPNGEVQFTGLPTGSYMLYYAVSQDGNTLFNSSFIELSGMPAQQVNLVLSTPLPPPLSVFLITNSSLTSPLLQFSTISFLGLAAGWLGNYTYSFKVTAPDGSVQTYSSNPFVYQFKDSGTYFIEVTVTSPSGTYFGVNYNKTATYTSYFVINIIQTPYIIYMSPQGNQQYFSVSYGNYPNAVLLVFTNNGVLAYFNATDNIPSFPPLPNYVQTALSVLGVSFSQPFYQIEFGINSGQPNIVPLLDGGLFTQGITANVHNASLSGSYVPNSITSFYLGAQPTAIFPIVFDIAEAGIAITFSALGLSNSSENSPINQVVDQAILTAITEYVISSLPQLINAYQQGGMSAAIQWLENNAISVLESIIVALINIVPQILKQLATKFPSSLLNKISSVLNKIQDFTPLKYITFAANVIFITLPIIGDILQGVRGEQYQVTGYQREAELVVDPTGVAPYVLVNYSSQLYGYNGTWISSSPFMLTSGYHQDGYAFTFPDPANFSIIVTVPPSTTATTYNISLMVQGHVTYVTGSVTKGSSQEYQVTATAQSITVEPIKPTTPNYQVNLWYSVVILIVAIASVYIVTKRKK